MSLLRGLISKGCHLMLKSTIHSPPSSLRAAVTLMVKLSFAVEFIMVQIYPKTFQICLLFRSRVMAI